MISHASFALRNSCVLLASCIVMTAALVGCRRSEKAADTVDHSASQKSDPVQSVPATLAEGTLSTTMPPEEVFKRALWRRPAPDDTILHAERREWTKDAAQGIARWEWFLMVQPGPALKSWLREQNPFSVHPVGNADAPEIKGAPPWFPADNSEYIVHAGGTAGNVMFLWSRQGNTLFATASGTGFAPGAPEPATPDPVPPAVTQGRLPQTPPPVPAKH
jgi:hypothetical protein